MYQVWAITQNGEGYATSLGLYSEVEDINIYSNLLQDDIKIEINYISPKQFLRKYPELGEELINLTE